MVKLSFLGVAAAVTLLAMTTEANAFATFDLTISDNIGSTTVSTSSPVGGELSIGQTDLDGFRLISADAVDDGSGGLSGFTLDTFSVRNFTTVQPTSPPVYGTVTARVLMSGLEPGGYGAFMDPSLFSGKTVGTGTATTNFSLYWGIGTTDASTSNLVCSGTMISNNCSGSNLGFLTLPSDYSLRLVVQTAFANGSGKSTYNSTAVDDFSVPEPASLALLGSALLLAGFAFGRQKKPAA